MHSAQIYCYVAPVLIYVSFFWSCFQLLFALIVGASLHIISEYASIMIQINRLHKFCMDRFASLLNQYPSSDPTYLSNAASMAAQFEEMAFGHATTEVCWFIKVYQTFFHLGAFCLSVQITAIVIYNHDIQ